MKKKVYMTPETTFFAEEPEQLLVISGGSDTGDLNVALEEDLSEEIQRARDFEF